MNKIYYQRPVRPSDRKKNDQTYIDNKQGTSYENVQEPKEQYFTPSYEMPEYEEAYVQVKQNNKVKEWIANGALIVLSILMVLGIVTLMIEFCNMDYDYTTKESHFWYAIDNGQYASEIRNMEHNIQSGVRMNREYEQIYAILDYFQAASLYRVAEFQKNTEKMDTYTEIMADSYEKIGDVSYLVEDINRKLGIE